MTAYTWTTAAKDAAMLLNFEPHPNLLRQVEINASVVGWVPNPYLVAARVCWLMSAGDGADIWAFRAEGYAVRGGYAPESLGIHVRPLAAKVTP